MRHTLTEALAILKLSRATLYRRAEEGKIKLVKDGHRTFVTAVELARYLAACESAADSAAAS